MDVIRGGGRRLSGIGLSKFILQLKRDGLPVNSRNQCLPPAPAFLVSFAGWNGATQNGTVGATVQGCG
jgi:hypothetical protein